MSEQRRAVELSFEQAVSSPELLQDLQSNPAETLKKLKKEVVESLPHILDRDPWIYRIVVSSLSLVVLLVVIGVIYLTVEATSTAPNIPDVLTALGSAAIGALAGLLAPSPGSST